MTTTLGFWISSPRWTSNATSPEEGSMRYDDEGWSRFPVHAPGLGWALSRLADPSGRHRRERVIWK